MVLKIIGITILAILAAVVLLILLVLFCPIRYKASGKYGGDGALASGKASWLFGAASVKLSYENGKPFRLKARLLFITVFDSLKSGDGGGILEKLRKRAKTRKKEPETNDALSPAEVSGEKDKAGEKAPDAGKAPVDGDLAIGGNVKSCERESLHLNETDFRRADESGDDIEKTGLLEKIKNFFEKIKKFIENIKFTFCKIYDTMVKAKHDVKYYWKLLHEESTQEAFSLCSRQLSKILKNISPKKYEVKLHLGFEDPAVMGNVLGAWGMLYPFHLGRIEITPEFDRKLLEGSFKLKGRISVHVFLWTLWLFMTDRNIKRLRKRLGI